MITDLIHVVEETQTKLVLCAPIGYDDGDILQLTDRVRPNDMKGFHSEVSPKRIPCNESNPTREHIFVYLIASN